MNAKGLSGQVKVSDEEIKITREGFRPTISYWGKKPTRIPISELKSIYVKKPAKSGTNGYIRFSRKEEARPRLRVLSGLYDRNTVMFKRKQSLDFKEVIKEINNRAKIDIQGAAAFKPRTNSEDSLKGERVEYKRTCNECGKTWHVSKEELEELKKSKNRNSLAGAATALSGQLAASSQSIRNKEAQEEKLKKAEKCPECGSQNYKEATNRFKE
jgi:DNA-directed RNA polymerase subunit M/transcription elongation factor TFIIS